MRRTSSSPPQDERGVAAVEFALIAPTFLFLLMALNDVGHTLYMQAQLQGIMQKAGRDSALEDAVFTTRTAAIDAKVTASVMALANNATVTFKRRYFHDYATADAKPPESWTDTDHDGRCDNGEPYQDANGNGVWDADGGDAGQGGAKDATVYSATVTYPHLFPMWRFIGMSPTAIVSATTVLRNQPYAAQSSYGAAVVRNCA